MKTKEEVKDKKIVDDRFQQDFELLLRDVKTLIKKFRKEWRIDSKKMRKELYEADRKQVEFLTQNQNDIFKAVRSSKYQELRTNFLGLLGKCRFIYVEDILRDKDKPLDWAFVLGWYILTGDKLPFSPNCKIYPDYNKGMVVMEIPPGANIQDFEKTFGKKKGSYSVSGLQGTLSGGNIRHKTRKKKNLEEKLNITKDQKKLRRKKIKPGKEFNEVEHKEESIGVRIVKAKERDKLVEKYKSKALGNIDAQKREEARQKMTYHRYRVDKKK